MGSLIEQIARAAARAVEMVDERDGGRVLDFSKASLSVVEELLEEASAFYDGATQEERDIVAHDFGCYILEVRAQGIRGTVFMVHATKSTGLGGRRTGLPGRFDNAG